MTTYSNTHLAGWYNFNKIEQAAERLRKQDPSLSREQAVARVAERRPDLVDAYHDEVRKDLGGGR